MLGFPGLGKVHEAIYCLVYILGVMYNIFLHILFGTGFLLSLGAGF